MTAKLTKVGNRVWAGLLVMLSVFSVPLLIWAAIILTLRQLIAEWRVIRAGFLRGNLTCSLDTDCPTSYQCRDGKCVPVPTR